MAQVTDRPNSSPTAQPRGPAREAQPVSSTVWQPHAELAPRWPWKWPALLAAACSLAAGTLVAILLYDSMIREQRPDAFVGQRRLYSLLFVYWVFSPGVGGAMFAWWTRYSTAQARLALAGVLVTFGISLPALLHGISIRPDPQGILALAFMPLFQWFGVLLTFMIALGSRSWLGGAYRSSSPLIAMSLGLGTFFLSMLAVILAIQLVR